MKNSNGKLKTQAFTQNSKDLNMLHNCTKFAINLSVVNISHDENKCKPCL